MSIDATIYVWKLKKSQVTATEKLVLLSYADRADEYGLAYPSVKRLVEDTILDRKTIFKAIASILEKGILKKTGEFQGRTKQVPVYQFPTEDFRENNDLDVKNSVKNINSPNFGTSPKIGTRTSPKIGTRNLPIEPTNESPKIKNTKKDVFTVQKMLENNPSMISKELIEEWIAYRKKPITERVWKKTNKVMSQLKNDHGIEPVVVFERMLEKQWQGMEINYFDDLINPKKDISKKQYSNNAFSNWRNNDKQGTQHDYDQFGNIIDPFS